MTLKRLAIAPLFCLLAWGDSRKQAFSDFVAPLPLPPGETLVIGIVGGWERWDNPIRITRRVALQLRDRNLPGVWVETVENHKLDLAEELVRKAFPEPSQARLVIFGQSLGARGAVRLCRTLSGRGVPVRRLVVVDAWGRDSRTIPPNVATVANLYQRGFPVRGWDRLVVQDAARTRWVENTRYDFSGRNVDLSDEFFLNRTFLGGHIRMEYEPQVWKHILRLIVEALPAVPAVSR